MTVILGAWGLVAVYNAFVLSLRVLQPFLLCRFLCFALGCVPA